MQLEHRFTVPTGVEQTWEHFNDIAAVGACFPGATVTEADEESFKGSVKVKLGPIALVYNGTGTFVEKDVAARRMVVEAKGKDKRGNGTAGADVTLTMSPSGTTEGATDVEVLTDLAITGKPAQFGRGVMQDVSDKLLGQFVACLEQRLGAGPESGADDAARAPEEASPASTPEPTPAGTPVGTGAGPAPTAAATAQTVSAQPASSGAEDSLDLGATVLPVLAKAYWKQAAAALGALVVLRWWRRRR